MVDCQSLSPPSMSWGNHNHMNPYDNMPQRPRYTKRLVSADVSKRVLDNLANLSAPQIMEMESPTKRMKHSFTFQTTSTNRSSFHAALQRMKAGGNALQKLQHLRDEEKAKADELTKRMEALSSSTNHEKIDTTSNTVTLGRNVQRRPSGAALSS